MNLQEIINKTKAYYCLGCGVCTSSCPVSKVIETFSPRLLVEKTVFGFGDEVAGDKDLWSCLACGRCSSRCPSGVDYLSFIREMRAEARSQGQEGIYSHDGILNTMMEIQTLGLRQDRTFWITDDLKIAENGDYFYFVGCLPYFNFVFGEGGYCDVGIDAVERARNTVRILNKMGIEPVVSNDERCCGHDAFWNGDIKTFLKLAELNLTAIKESGAKKVICACPEGYMTLKKDYPLYLGEHGLEVIHLYQLLMDALQTGNLILSENEPEISTKVTYHDPCSLGRMAQIYEEPRELISRILGAELIEMERNRAHATCCGTSGWVNCSICSKKIQMERLQEAEATGADILITACPKCEIHLSCAKYNSDIRIGIKDLTDLLVEKLT